MFNCTEHSDIILECEQCFSSVKSLVYLTVDNSELRSKLKSIKRSNENLLKSRNSILYSLHKIKSTLYLKSSVIPKSSTSYESYLKYIQTLILPNDILAIIYSPEFSLSFLLQKNFIASTKNCKCGQICKLAPFEKSFIFNCSCGFKCPVTDNTVFECRNMEVGKAVLIIFLFIMNQTNSSISDLTSIEKKDIRRILGNMKSIISNYYIKNLPKFRGVVEIDESCFRTVIKTPGKPAADKWVFGIYERERKLIYMELVKNRTADILLPIIQKVCEMGTTVISDQWSAYQKLTELGFPHYTVDHSRFFVNPTSREIHTQNIEISWCWAKYWIKRHKKFTGLQDMLNTFCWIRQFKMNNKKCEIATAINELSIIMNENLGSFGLDKS